MNSYGPIWRFKAGKKIKRRTFLKIAGLTATATLLAACTSLIQNVKPTAPALQETPVNKDSQDMNEVVLEQPDHSFALRLTHSIDGAAGLVISTGSRTAWESQAPLELEHFYGGQRTTVTAGYSAIQKVGNALEGEGTIIVGGGVVQVKDSWTMTGNMLRLERVCRVTSAGQGGFLTRVRFNLMQPVDDTPRPFVPGMIYGGPEHLTNAAIGGALTWRHGYDYTVLIREDRIPNPLAALYVPGGLHLTLFDAAPTGIASMRDTEDTEGIDMIVDGMTLNSLGYQRSSQAFSMLFCAPANEGDVTYQGTTYPGGQKMAWRRRYQSLREGADVSFSMGLVLSQEASFAEYASNAWRAVFNHLAPKAQHHNIEQVTDALVLTLVSQVRDIQGGGRGLPNFLDAVSKQSPDPQHDKAILGFTGKNIEAANFMLRWADDHPTADGDLARREGEAIIAKFIELKVNPPEAEGYNMVTGLPELAISSSKRVYLRSFGDDMKSLARAFLREKAAGRVHPDWQAWMTSFADWLIGQQRSDGSFPRAWAPVTGEVIEDSPWTTYNPIPFLTLITGISGDPRYLDSAIKAGEFCWNNGHANFVFIGGTIDNPNIIDKEAGTLSLEAYLALQRATGDEKWIARAEMAARFSETFIYVWNIPMPVEEDDANLQWKKGVPTIGLQIIATGHSLVDEYMAYDVDEFAKIYKLTGDTHYLDVARILLHGTKSMISLPGRLFDLGEPGWQQEHWSLAPRRGYGLHRGWLPWVTTSHLAGIYDLKDFEAGLYARLVAEE